MTLSSDCSCRCGLVGGVVAEHGPQDVEAAAGQRENGLDVGLAFGAFPVVIGAGCGVVPDGDLSRQVAGP
jgi:hypothetical protein